MKLLFAALTLLLFSACLQAKEASPVSSDPELETRMMSLAQELRCLVCQNETLADSQADLAADLRQEIRIQLRQGKNDQQVLDFMVQRYGDFVRFRPEIKSTTILLWFGPLILLLVGVSTLIVYLKKRQKNVADVAISEEDARRINSLLQNSNHQN